MRRVLAIALLLGGCDWIFEKKPPPPEPPIQGTLRLTYDNDAPIALTHALVVSQGGKSFGLYMTNKPLSCEWAKGDTWRYRNGEATARFDVAPVLQADGSTRWEIGKGWWGNESLSKPDASYHHGSILPSQHWPIEITSSGAGCPTRIRFDGQRRKDSSETSKSMLTLEGDFTPACCLGDVPKLPAGIKLKIGSDEYPISHAEWFADAEANEEVYRLRHTDGPCWRDVWYEDLALDLHLSDEGKKKKVFLLGRSVYRSSGRSWLNVVSQTLSVARVKDGNHLEVHGTLDVAHPMADSATFRIAVDGIVPITAGCYFSKYR